MMIYQVHFSVENVGKYREKTKKRAKWVYQVDGQNHEVEFVWSLRSGKQEVTVDGQEVMFSKRKGRSVFDERLTNMGEIPDLRLVCARKAPIKAHPNFQCHELLINDKPFGDYPFLHPEDRESSGCVAEDSAMTTNPDVVMDSSVEWGDEPMSILDILFPGKYREATANRVDLEEDMGFPAAHDVEEEEEEEEEHHVPAESPAAPVDLLS